MEINWKKNTVLFLGAQTVSLFGSSIAQYGIGWYITLKTQSGSMLTAFIIAGVLPTLFISPFGGVWADRYNKKYLINGADASIALATLCAAVCLQLGSEPVGMLLFCAVIRALGQGIQSPAVNSFIPLIVPREHLARINGINGTVNSLLMLVAPMLSAALLAAAPLQTLFFIDIATAAIGISIVFFFVRVPHKISIAPELPARQEAAAQKPVVNYFADIKEGLVYIRKNGYLWRMIVLSAIFNIAAAPAMFLTPLQVTRNYGAEVWRLSAIEICFSGGLILGGILISAWGGFKNRVYSMALSGLLFGAEVVSLGVIQSFAAYLVIMGIMGITGPVYETPSLTMFQTKIDSAYTGRVFGVFGMVSGLLMPAGMLIFGPLGDVAPIELLLIGTGIVIFLSNLPLVFSKVLRDAGKETVQYMPAQSITKAA